MPTDPAPEKVAALAAAEQPIDIAEASARQADRLMASASYERPRESSNEPQTVIGAPGKFGRTVYVRFAPSDIQAVIDELAIGAPCGICHRMRCRERAES